MQNENQKEKLFISLGTLRMIEDLKGKEIEEIIESRKGLTGFDITCYACLSKDISIDTTYGYDCEVWPKLVCNNCGQTETLS